MEVKISKVKIEKMAGSTELCMVESVSIGVAVILSLSQDDDIFFSGLLINPYDYAMLLVMRLIEWRPADVGSGRSVALL